MKFTLIPHPRRERFTIRRRDVIHGKRALAATQINSRTVSSIFMHSCRNQTELREAKGLVYRDACGVWHVRFWNEGNNEDRDVHHQDALADLLYQEAEGLKRLAEHTKDERYHVMAAERAQLALGLNAVRQNPSKIYPEDILLNAQGFKLRCDADCKIRVFTVDSGITRAQIRLGVVLEGDLLSEMITRIHEAIAPELRAYREILVNDFQKLRINGAVTLPDGFRLVDG
jgi:hypothetical protein